MLYDPGAAYTVIGESTWRQIGSPPLTATPALIAYTNVPVETMGKASVPVKAFRQSKKLEIFVVKKDDQPLFGLDWCIAFNLKLPPGVKICQVTKSTSPPTPPVVPNDISSNDPSVQQLVKEFPTVFNGDDSAMLGHKAVVHIRRDAT